MERIFENTLKSILTLAVLYVLIVLFTACGKETRQVECDIYTRTPFGGDLCIDTPDNEVDITEAEPEPTPEPTATSVPSATPTPTPKSRLVCVEKGLVCSKVRKCKFVGKKQKEVCSYKRECDLVCVKFDIITE